jgi:predicted RNase H-like HicB family nuclease
VSKLGKKLIEAAKQAGDLVRVGEDSKTYLALIHMDADSDYGVSFPDFPGCIAAGKDPVAARAMAEEALALHVAGMIADGTPIPLASSLAQIQAQTDSAVLSVITVPYRG